MWYMPYLRVRRAAIVYALFVIGISLLAIALRYWPGVFRINARQSAELFAVDVTIAQLLSGAAALVGGLATALGLNLAAENDGHLEVAWTKPASRETYALGVFAVDIAAMIACIVVTVVCGGIVADCYIGRQAIVLPSMPSLLSAVAFCGFPLCVYAWVTALSASLKRNRGSVAALFWPLMFALAILEVIPLQPIHALAVALNSVNPVLMYTQHADTSNLVGSQSVVGFFGYGLSFVLLSLAVLQWKRLQI